MARSRGKALFHDPQGGFPPLPRLKVVRNSLREVDHDAEHGPINRRTDRHRGHCQSLGGDRPIVEPATSQSCLDERSESGWGGPAHSGAGISIGSSEVELTKRRSGCRSTTTRLTYQSPSAVSELVGMTSVAGSNEFSFRVGRSMTMSQSSCGSSDVASMVILKYCNRNQRRRESFYRNPRIL